MHEYVSIPPCGTVWEVLLADCTPQYVDGATDPGASWVKAVCLASCDSTCPAGDYYY